MGNPYIQQHHQQPDSSMPYAPINKHTRQCNNHICQCNIQTLGLVNGMMMPPPNMMGMIHICILCNMVVVGIKMAMMMMMQQQQQAQQQQAQMQQLKQQEEENKRIQQEMEALLRTQDNSKVDYQRRELQKIMREVSSQVSNLVTHAQPALPHTYAPPGREGKLPLITQRSVEIHCHQSVVTEDELRTLSMLPKERSCTEYNWIT